MTAGGDAWGRPGTAALGLATPGSEAGIDLRVSTG